MEIPSLVRGAVSKLPLIGRGSSPTTDATAWRLRAAGDEAFEGALLEQSIVAIGTGEVGDLTEVPSPERLRAMLAKAMPERNASAIGTFAGYWSAFRSTIAPGDIVVVPLHGDQVAVGEVTGAYEYRKGQRDKRLRHVRPVRWLTTGLARASLPDDLNRSIRAPGTLARIKVPDAATRLRALS